MIPLWLGKYERWPKFHGFSHDYERTKSGIHWLYISIFLGSLNMKDEVKPLVNVTNIALLMQPLVISMKVRIGCT